MDRDGRRLWVLGKGKAQKEARTLPTPTMEAIDSWLAVRRGVVHDDEAALLVNVAGLRPGLRMTGNGLYRVIRSLGDAAGIRRVPMGYGTRASRPPSTPDNGDVRAAQAHARHANPQTTMRYDDNRQDLAGKVAAELADALLNSN